MVVPPVAGSTTSISQIVQRAPVTPNLPPPVRALNATDLPRQTANPAGDATVLPPTNSEGVALAEGLGYVR